MAALAAFVLKYRVGVVEIQYEGCTSASSYACPGFPGVNPAFAARICSAATMIRDDRIIVLDGKVFSEWLSIRPDMCRRHNTRWQPVWQALSVLTANDDLHDVTAGIGV